MKLTKRNKVVIPVVLLLGIVVGGAVVLQTKGLLAALLDAGRKITYDCQSDTDADCDNDGLKNWQEKLYHTDSNNPDSDGDGYLDGEEVASEYDPTVKAPNDALPDTDTGKPRTPPKNLTLYLTQIISQKMSAGEIIPSSTNITDIAQDPDALYNEQTITDAFAQIGERAKAYFAIPDVKDSDIKISNQPTSYEELGIYIAKMAQAALPSDDLVQLQKTEITIIQDAVTDKDMTEIKILISSTQRNIADMKNVTAPKDFSEIHKRYISLLKLDEKILEAVQDMQIDPATAMAGLETYPQMIDAMHTLSDDLNAKIKSYQN